MTSPHIPGGTSTGSKQPHVFFGSDAIADLPVAMARGLGARLWDPNGREYLDFGMGLGAVALGYAHPEVVRAAQQAVADGATGSLAPVTEDQLAGVIVETIPWIEQLRFLKSGAEALAAAVRIARVATGRTLVLTCGYHGWLDWCQAEPGVPPEVTGLRNTIPFNDPHAARRTIGQLEPAAVVIEPVIDGPPDPAWLEALRDSCTAAGSVLVFDEIKTAFRIALGGAAERYVVRPDLVVLGKALANGFPLAVVGGPRELMDACRRTWISSTLATESVSLAAGLATVRYFRSQPVVTHLEQLGTRLFNGLERLSVRSGTETRVVGIPQMCYLALGAAAAGQLARGMVEHGIIWKPTAYDFVSYAHDAADIDCTLATMAEVLDRMQDGD